MKLDMVFFFPEQGGSEMLFTISPTETGEKTF